MEAIDTVMDKDEMIVCSLVSKYPFRSIENVIRETAVHQAEHTFPLGEKQGIEKVVEWITEHHAIYPCQYGLDHYDLKGNEVLIHQKPCLNCDWQAFLREKGIKPS